MNPDQPHSYRRSFRFSLRTMLVVLTVLTVCVAFVTNGARERLLALEEIEEVGGGVLYEHVRSGSEAPGPAWLRRLIGEECFVSVLNVLLPEASSVDDAKLEKLLPFAELQCLVLTNTQVSDAGLEQVGGLTNLIFLKLRGTRITDSGLPHLKGLTKLQDLDLSQTQVSDASVIHLKEFTNLQWLHLSGTRITEEGYETLLVALPDCQIVPP